MSQENTETTIEPSMAALIKFDITDAAIAELANKNLALKVRSPDDKEGYAICDCARKEMKKLRIDVDKRRKDLKADSLAFGRKVDEQAKSITDRLIPIEEHLVRQLKIVEEAEERRKQEEERQRAEKFRTRANALQKLGAIYDSETVKQMSDQEFSEFHTGAAEHFERKQAARKVERERLEKLEAERVELQRKIELEREEARKKERIEREERDALEARAKEAEAKARELQEREDRRVAAERAEKERRSRKPVFTPATEKMIDDTRKMGEELDRISNLPGVIALVPATSRAFVDFSDGIRVETSEEIISRRCPVEFNWKPEDALDDPDALRAIKENFPSIQHAWLEIHRLKGYVLALEKVVSEKP